MQNWKYEKISDKLCPLNNKLLKFNYNFITLTKLTNLYALYNFS